MHVNRGNGVRPAADEGIEEVLEADSHPLGAAQRFVGFQSGPPIPAARVELAAIRCPFRITGT